MNKKNFFLLFTISLFSLLPAFSSKVDIPPLVKPVMDTADMIDSYTEAQLDDYIEKVYEQTKVQIAVFTLTSLEGLSIEEISMKTAEKWKLGQAKKDNGVLLTVSYKDREVRIDTGYGLEGLLTDAKCSRIIREYIIPQFKEENYSQGILNAVLKITEIATDGAKIKTDLKVKGKKSSASPLIPLIIWLLFVLLAASVKSGYGPFGFFYIAALLTGKPFYKRIPKRKSFSDDDDDNDIFTSGFTGRSSGNSYRGGGGRFGGGGASGKW